jgi:SAM-dependent methyltransferase
MTVDIVRFNKRAWDRQVQQGNRWTLPVSPEETARARRGDWHVLLTPTRPVPTSWFPPLSGLDLLCLASGGGQQGPIFAAAGANVTVFDNSPGQLAQDRMVAGRDSLDIQTVEGDMVDLSCFPDNCFDLIFHPVSNTFIPAVRPVWQEAYRVLRSGGALLAGFNNPVIYIFDFALYEEGVLQAKYALPYSDLTSLSEEEKERFLHEDAPLEFGHLLEDQIGGQIDAGFLIAGFYEDGDPAEPLSNYMPGYIATRAVKL